MRLATLIMAALSLTITLPAGAELCGQCTGRSYTKDIGKCTLCDGMTLSGQFKLCMKCSDRLGQCHHCLASLKIATTQPASTQPVDQNRDCHYSEGAWEYRFTITNAGTRSEGRSGELLCHGQPVAEPAGINDYYNTPWGRMYWVGQSAGLHGARGWMVAPRAGREPGKQLPEPAGQGQAKVDISQPGTYRSGQWEYRLRITAVGTKSEGIVGELFFDGKPVGHPTKGDYHQTPWGNMYWVGDPVTPWGAHGWMVRKSLLREVEGRALPAPAGAGTEQ